MEGPWQAPHQCPYPLSAFCDIGFIGRPSTDEEHTDEANSYFFSLALFVGNDWVAILSSKSSSYLYQQSSLRHMDTSISSPFMDPTVMAQQIQALIANVQELMK